MLPALSVSRPLRAIYRLICHPALTFPHRYLVRKSKINFER